MTLTRPFPIDKAFPNAIDLRKQASGVYPREGVFPDPITIAPPGIAFANGGWNIGARPFVYNTKRGGAPYSQAYGSAQGTNDSSVTAWTIGAAPASGVRVDRLWVRATDYGQGEALTTPGGETVPRGVPVFGVTAGTPDLAALPAGAFEIAQASVPAGAASIANATITQTYGFANVSGGTLYFHNATAMAAATVIDGDIAYVLATQTYHYRVGGAWVGANHPGTVAGVSGTVVQGGTRVWRTPDGIVHGYIDLIRTEGIPNNAPIAIVGGGFRPPGNYDFGGTISEGGTAGPVFVRVEASGNIVVFNPAPGNQRVAFSFKWPKA